MTEAFDAGQEPREIQRTYPTLNLEQVYAAITYYLGNKEEVTRYLEHGERIAEAYYKQYLEQGPPPLAERLKGLRAKQQAGNAIAHE